MFSQTFSLSFSFSPSFPPSLSFFFSFSWQDLMRDLDPITMRVCHVLTNFISLFLFFSLFPSFSFLFSFSWQDLIIIYLDPITRMANYKLFFSLSLFPSFCFLFFFFFLVGFDEISRSYYEDGMSYTYKLSLFFPLSISLR